MRAFLVFFICWLGIANGQNRRFQHYPVEKLPSPFVANFVEDGDGFLWITTRGGLCRFDGQNFKVFQHNPDEATSLSNNYIRHLYADKEQRLWLATFGSGLSLYDKYTETFQNFVNPISPESNRIHGVAEDTQKRIWLATEGGGLQFFDKRKRQYRSVHPKGLNHKISPQCRSLLLGNEHTLWIGTVGKGFYCFNLVTHSFDTSYCHLAKGLEIMDFVEDGSDTLYLASNEGLIKISKKQRRILQWYKADSSANGPVASRIFSMEKSKQNQIWMVTVSGLSIFDLKTKRFENYSENRFDPWSIREKRLLSIYLDKKGLAWIGSWNQGFYSTPVSGLGFQNLRTKPTPPPIRSFSEIMDIQPAGSEAVWLTTQSDGLIRYNFNTQKMDFFSPNALMDTAVKDKQLLACFEDKEGKVWIGNAVKFAMHCSGKEVGKRFFVPFADLEKNPIPIQATIFKEDKMGNLWMATFQGLYCFNRQKKRVYKFRFRDRSGKESKAINQLFSLEIAQNGTIFLASNGGGLIAYFPNRRKYLIFDRQSPGKAPLKAAILATVKEDKKGRIWVGSENQGLFVSSSGSPGSFKWFSTANSLPENNVEAIEFDDLGNIWVAGKNLSRLHVAQEKDGLPEKLDIQAFTSPEFAMPNLYKTDVSLKMPDGRLFFGGSDGLIHFQPAEIRKNLPLSQGAITSLKVMEEDWTGDSSILFKKYLVLPYDQNFLRISFANLGFAGLEASKCRYQLEGLQNNWIEDQHHGEARFTDLNPGKYLFRLQAGNLERKWNPTEARLWIEILPPWWQTWWFYGLVLSSTLLGTSLFLKRRIENIKFAEQQRNLAERKKLEMELKVLRTQLNPHFMFNALNSIEDFIWKKEVELASEYLARFARLMRLILENSMHETVLLEKELEALRLYLQLEALRMENKFDFEIQVEPPGLAEELEIPPMLLQPFVENAILHGIAPLKDRRGLVKIEIRQLEHELEFKISDNGVGRQSKSGTHVSLGTSLTRDRIVKLNKGNTQALKIIDLKDEAQNPLGTLVMILLPLE